jgi:hypothetical protein
MTTSATTEAQERRDKIERWLELDSQAVAVLNLRRPDDDRGDAGFDVLTDAIREEHELLSELWPNQAALETDEYRFASARSEVRAAELLMIIAENADYHRERSIELLELAQGNLAALGRGAS